MKFRRHHNNKGRAQIKTGNTATLLRRLAKRMGAEFAAGKDAPLKKLKTPESSETEDPQGK